MAWERVADWGWSLVLLVLGGVGAAFSRWLSMLHKHEKQLTLLEQTQVTRIETDRAMVQNMTTLTGRLEEHRKESAERIDALRHDLRDDFKTLLDFARRQDDRGN